MTLSQLEINKRLDIIWSDKICKSIVQDVSEDSISIAAPLVGGVYLPLHRGDAFRVIYYKDEKEIYEFWGKVTGRAIENNIQLILLEYPTEIKQIQRREYVRVDISHPIQIVKTLLEAELKNCDRILETGKGKNATMVDLSGGGMKLKTTEKMELNNFVAVDVDLMDKKITVHGKVVRVFAEEGKNYVCGITFIHLNERVRDKLIQLIFEIMRKQIKTS